MSSRSLGTPDDAAQEYERWVAASGAVDDALSRLRDGIVSALPDEAARGLLAQVEVVEELMAKGSDHVENFAKALAAALVQRKGG